MFKENGQVFWLSLFTLAFPASCEASGDGCVNFYRHYSYGDSAGFAPASLFIPQGGNQSSGAKIREGNKKKIVL